MSLVCLNPNPSDLRPSKGWKLMSSCADGTWLTCGQGYRLDSGWNESSPSEFPLYTRPGGEAYPRGFEVLLEKPRFDPEHYLWLVAVPVEIDPQSIQAFGWQVIVGHPDRIEAVVASRIRVPTYREWQATRGLPMDTTEVL